MPYSEAELAAVADLVEAAHVRVVRLLGTRAAEARVRAVLDDLACASSRRGDPDSAPTPLLSPRPALDAPRGRKTAPATPAARRRGR